jgi:hypothetical protein
MVSSLANSNGNNISFSCQAFEKTLSTSFKTSYPAKVLPGAFLLPDSAQKQRLLTLSIQIYLA